ncbi:MAG: hypothetical protein Q4D03_07745 [Bacteroidales bacterium]|nr:hypothetical protein [Bacteroidales bacterium]
MFEFFKRKKNRVVEPIFASLSVDMHSHLVPHVDDGSRSTEETLECMRVMQQVGYKQMYITPHFQYPRFPNKEDDITNRYNRLCDDLKENGVTMQMMGIGGEYRIDDSFADRVANPQFLQIGQKNKYLLVELSLHQIRMGIEETIFDLMMKGYDVILAHPERYPYYSSTSRKLQNLKEQGVYFQCNVLSLSGFYGEAAQSNAYAFIENDWVEFLGTDMHNTMYADALLECAANKKVQKLMQTHTFLNSKELL